MATAAGWDAIARNCRRIAQEGRRTLVVCSALSGVSNRLEELIAAAERGGGVSVAIAGVKAKHQALADELGVPMPGLVDREIEELERLLSGIQLLREAPPRIRARIMATGELMSTHLGAVWLRAQGVATGWVNARTLLSAEPDEVPPAQHYLSAHVEPALDPAAVECLPKAPVVLTQGFIASDPEGDTVLLGRGGSDTSASCLAVVIGAVRVEIWTDVPGLFTANPKRFDSARQLTALGYDEAATMASLGAEVLHPRCVGPARRAGLPIHVRSTYTPDHPGTVVKHLDTPAGIKAVTGRQGLALLRLNRPSRWQPIGFVADVSACFKRRGLSIDMMSTSPSTVMITVDPSSAPGACFDALVDELEAVCEVTLERVASVSLVGTGVREAFDPLGDVFRKLDGVSVEMLCQGASDHHLTFVVQEELAAELEATLHSSLFEEAPIRLPPLPVLEEAQA